MSTMSSIRYIDLMFCDINFLCTLHRLLRFSMISFSLILTSVALIKNNALTGKNADEMAADSEMSHEDSRMSICDLKTVKAIFLPQKTRLRHRRAENQIMSLNCLLNCDLD